MTCDAYVPDDYIEQSCGSLSFGIGYVISGAVGKDYMRACCLYKKAPGQASAKVKDCDTENPCTS
ncbi:MAG: hypothetical protein AAF682_27535 [Planctomycetota bacterium]